MHYRKHPHSVQCPEYFFRQYAVDARHAGQFFDAGLADALQAAEMTQQGAAAARQIKTLKLLNNTANATEKSVPQP